MTINNVISNGIVLKSLPYKENDALLSVFTKEYGKVTLLAKGIKKIKSKNSPACQSLTKSEFTFIPRIGISTLIKATSIDYYMLIKKDIIKEAYASFILEFYYKNCTDNQPNIEEYNLINTYLTLLNSQEQSWLLYVLLISSLLELSGSKLCADGCVRCNSTQIHAISIKEGGFICTNCKSQYDHVYSNEFLKFFRLICKGGFNHFDKIVIDDIYEEDFVQLFEAFFEEFIGMYMKSKKFIEQFRDYR